MLSGAERKTFPSERLLAFTDAVMAVAITLLVLDLKLPAGVTDADLPKVLANSMHGLWCYVLSFLVIGLLWMAHHSQFSYIGRVDAALMWINLFFLMTVGFIPFVTSVMSDHGSAMPTMMYAAVLFLTCLLLAAAWGYARRAPGLMDADVPEAERREGLITPLLIALVSPCRSQSPTYGARAQASGLGCWRCPRPRRRQAQISALEPRSP